MRLLNDQRLLRTTINSRGNLDYLPTYYVIQKAYSFDCRWNIVDRVLRENGTAIFLNENSLIRGLRRCCL